MLFPTTKYHDLMHSEVGNIFSRKVLSTWLLRQGSSLWWCFLLTDHLLLLLLLWISVSSKTRLPLQCMSNLPRGRLGSQRPACYGQLLHIVQSCARCFLFLSFLHGYRCTGLFPLLCTVVAPQEARTHKSFYQQFWLHSSCAATPSSPVIPACSSAREVVIRPCDKRSRTPHPQQFQQGSAMVAEAGMFPWALEAPVAPSLCPLQSPQEQASALALNLLLICMVGPGTSPFPLGLFGRAHTVRRVVSPHLCNFSGDQRVQMRLQAFQTTNPTVSKG